MIDKNSPLPIYYQIEEYIKERIQNKQFQPGDILPSEREMAETFNISRMTVRQAINNLVNENLLFRKKGKGTFVAEKKIAQPLQGLTSFTEDMKNRGMIPSNRLLFFDEEIVDPAITKELGIDPSAKVYLIRRVRLADGSPIALETSYIPIDLTPGLTADVIQTSFYHYVEDTLNHTIDYGTQVIGATLASTDEKEYLHVEKGEPLLQIQRKTHLKDGRVLELVRSSYRADRYTFITTMHRS
ncbi:GntR family transcriptional regulator [Alteribacter populi]|uniref:GntR family transcriptional regulator n=1 Tax=Alteribacter populi TaxID=2011011 RepID=UPI000BBB45FB|nr:GntR family transcriptional regulator [Alteribacter populi]